jgi:hypothetical protein
MLRTLTPIGHCSKRLRRKLEIEEEQALGWRVKVQRRDDSTEVANAGKGGRWHIAPTFAVPGPFGNRPTSPEGHVSFHFAWTTVSKSPNGKSVVADSRGKVSETDRAPGDHDKYIARDGAVMTIGPAEFDRYTARENVAVPVAGNAEVALLSNISLDPAVRATFWNAVHATARKAGPDRLVLDPKRASRKEWSALAAVAGIPSNIRQIAADFAAGEQTRKAEFPMSEAEAGAVLDLLSQIVPGVERKQGPVRFARGRKGRTQYRLEMELPHGVGDAARVRLMIRVAEEVKATGAMYTIALHKPDEHNDDRNYHLHLVAHDRPAKLMDGKWDFTIATAVEGQSNRVAYRDRHKKVVIPGLTTASNRGDFEAFLKDLRGRYAGFCNEELLRAGRTRLFDPRRYSEMGIDRKPTKALGSRLAPLEAAGVATKVGTANAEIIWTYELLNRLKRCEADRLQRERALADLRLHLERQDSTDREDQSARAMLDRALRATEVLDVAEPELAEYEVTLAMARARPAKVVDTCSRILAEIEAGRGSSTDRRNRILIETRREAAQTFLRDIERIDRANQKIIADQQPKIDQARQDLAVATGCFANLAVPSPQVSLSASTPALSRATTVPNGPESGRSRDGAVLLASKPDVPMQQEPIIEPERSLTLEAIIGRIKNDRLIVLGPDYHDGDGYRVGGVTRDELRVLTDPNVADRAQFELAHLAKMQIGEIEAACQYYRRFGPTRAQAMAATSKGRPAPNTDPLGVLRTYRTHPRAAQSMGWDSPKQVEPGRNTPSIWRRMRASIADSLSRPAVPRTEKQPELHAARPPVNWRSEPPLFAETESTKPIASVEDAIAHYAEVIRTSVDVRFITVDGEPRIDPSSIPDWKRSVHAFEDCDVVKAAITDRWEEAQSRTLEIERQQMASESLRAAKRARIIAGLDAGELIAHRGKDGWVVEGRDEDLAFAATQWSEHAQLGTALRESEARWLRGGAPSTVRQAPPPLPPPHRPLGLHPAASAAELTAPKSPAPPPTADYTLAEQQWIRGGKAGRVER